MERLIQVPDEKERVSQALGGYAYENPKMNEVNQHSKKAGQ